MTIIHLTITIDESKLSTNNYTKEQIIKYVKDEILSALNYEDPDIAKVEVIHVST